MFKDSDFCAGIVSKCQSPVNNLVCVMVMILQRFTHLFMTVNLRLLLAVVLIYPLCGMAQGVDELVARLRGVECYDATVEFSVLMSLQDDVAYRVDLHSSAAPDDTLSPCDYLIRWTVPGAEATATTDGFSAYFSGNLFTYRGERMVERHFESDSMPFLQSGNTPGVQRRTQFAELLPQFIADEICAITASPDYQWHIAPDTIVEGRKAVALKATLVLDGSVSREALYAFDSDTGMPYYISTDNNPGALAEQTIIARYVAPSSPMDCGPLSDKVLQNLYPKVFEKYRDNTFAIVNLPGQPLPRFALATLTGERYTYHGPSQGFKAPTLVVVLDPVSAFAKETVDGVRDAVMQLPYNADVIWAAVSNDRDAIDSLLPADGMGETTLVSAKGLARDCGTATFSPVVVMVGTDGIVADVVVGYNKSFVTDVIQKAAVLH